MGDTQVAAMEPAVAGVYEGITKPDDPPASCCTIESQSASGSKVWIQVMPGTVNMGYPFETEPLETLRNQCVDTPPGMYLTEWNANEYATFGFENVAPHDHAVFVDQLFVRVLGCDDATYTLEISVEALDT